MHRSKFGEIRQGQTYDWDDTMHAALLINNLRPYRHRVIQTFWAFSLICRTRVATSS